MLKPHLLKHFFFTLILTRNVDGRWVGVRRVTVMYIVRDDEVLAVEPT